MLPSGQVLFYLLVNETQEIHIVGCLSWATVFMEQPPEQQLTLVSLLANTELWEKRPCCETLSNCALLQQGLAGGHWQMCSQGTGQIIQQMK